MDLAPFVQVLSAGGVVACPTETLVGLLADARSPAAVAQVVAIKQRGDAPVAVLVPGVLHAVALALNVPEAARALMEDHWPGPLTIVLRARPGLPPGIAPDGTVGMRMPGPSPALDLVRAFGGPLTATSCNPSGLPAAQDERDARAYFGHKVAAYVPGRCGGSLASTIVDATGSVLRILRRGAVALDLPDAVP
jgi:L-threonylcarbamoyladenylate synthase